MKTEVGIRLGMHPVRGSVGGVLQFLEIRPLTKRLVQANSVLNNLPHPYYLLAFPSEHRMVLIRMTTGDGKPWQLGTLVYNERAVMLLRRSLQ